MMRALLWMTIFLLPSLLWWQQTGGLAIYFTDAAPPGQLPYVLSKLAGLYALLVMAWQLIATLLEHLFRVSTIKTRFRWLGVSHRVTGMIIVGLSLTHLSLFFTAASLRQESLAWTLFLPDFKDYYHLRLSAGLVGFWCLCLVVVSGFFRYIGPSIIFKWLHKAYIVAIGLVYFHALSVGSEAQAWLGFGLYLGLGAVILVLISANVTTYIWQRTAVTKKPVVA